MAEKFSLQWGKSPLTVGWEVPHPTHTGGGWTGGGLSIHFCPPNQVDRRAGCLSVGGYSAYYCLYRYFAYTSCLALHHTTLTCATLATHHTPHICTPHTPHLPTHTAHVATLQFTGGGACTTFHHAPLPHVMNGPAITAPHHRTHHAPRHHLRACLCPRTAPCMNRPLHTGGTWPGGRWASRCASATRATCYRPAGNRMRASTCHPVQPLRAARLFVAPTTSAVPRILIASLSHAALCNTVTASVGIHERCGRRTFRAWMPFCLPPGTACAPACRRAPMPVALLLTCCPLPPPPPKHITYRHAHRFLPNYVCSALPSPASPCHPHTTLH